MKLFSCIFLAVFYFYGFTSADFDPKNWKSTAHVGFRPIPEARDKFNSNTCTSLEFKGIPVIKQYVYPPSQVTGKLSVKLDSKEKQTYRLVISKIGDRYYWATRENREMVLTILGVYLNYIAIDGSGYVRVIMPRANKIVGFKYDYVEFLFNQMGAITYFGLKED